MQPDLVNAERHRRDKATPHPKQEPPRVNHPCAEKGFDLEVQMGYGRAGFYTYDIADNGGFPSADRILDEYQRFEVGDWAFNMNSVFGIELPINEFDAFKVKAYETNNWLLWEKPGSTWSWFLKQLPDRHTRLILRIRARPESFFWTLFMEFGDPPMARRMLKGIKSRSERLTAQSAGVAVG
jgi:hypothetical protein